MRSLLASVRREDGYDRIDSAVQSLEDQWRHGEPSLERHWLAHDPDRTVSVLAALVKADLRCRFARGERPAVQDYLGRFPALRDESERVLSLIYEEFCLCEERGERPDVESFCRRYAPWRDSLASQLKYHELLSRVASPPSSPPPFPRPGDHFLEFSIDAVLGQGGAARVYRARNDLLGGREVALKVSPDRGHEPSIMGRLDHEHIVPVHGVVFEPETRLRGLVMPYRPGLPLDAIIRRVDPASLPASARVLWDAVAPPAGPDRATPGELVHPGWSGFPLRGSYAQGVAWLMAALADAVAHAHAREIHHRDIKPANILLTRSHGPQLLDFNLAHDPHAAEQAEAALRGGTLPYMAPEQLEAFIDPARWGAVDTAADLYSLGLVMHELLTGQPPDVPDQALPLPRAIRALLDRRADQRFAPRRHNPTIPHALEAITLRCLAYAPTGRYPSAQALADDLRRFLQDRPLRHAVNPSASERLRSWSRRNWAPLAGLSAVALVALVLAIRQMIPIENRSSFRAAVAAAEGGDHPKALGLLKPIADEFPNSPLVQLYCAAEHAEAGQIGAAAWRYTLASQAPGADGHFRDWARVHPRVVRQFEVIGVRLFDGEPLAPKQVDNPYANLAREALGTAIRLGSTDASVLVRDALCDEASGDVATAIRKMDRLISLIQAGAPDERDRRLATNQCFFLRARMLIEAGKASLDDDSGGALALAESHYKLAGKDLDDGEKLLEGRDAKQRYQYEMLRISAELGLCDLAIRLQNLDAARKQFKKPHDNLKRYQLTHEEDLGFKRLWDEANRLEEKLNAVPPASLSAAGGASSPLDD